MSDDVMAPEHGALDTLPLNIIVFGRVLRRLGLGAQPDRMMLFAQALTALGLRSREDVKASGRAIFVRSPAERRRYDIAFDAFWSMLANAEHSNARVRRHSHRARAGQPQNADDPNDAVKPHDARHREAATAEPSHSQESTVAAKITPHGDRSFTYSFAEALHEKDFSRLTKAEIDLAHELTRHKQLELGKRRSRRTRRGAGGIFDARRTLRASLRRFGEPIELQTRMRREKQRDVVLLCDVSGSMDRYARLLLQFVHALRHSIGKVEAFVFGTRLTRITHQIRNRDVNLALDEIASTVSDWGGGTRIGESLHTFNVEWARRVLARGAIVIIISDGWDRGDVALLAHEMQRLQRMSFRLIWLNPLLGGRNYRPQTIGMRAALPYIDDFLPANNLKSLVQLITALGSVDRRRPARPQTQVEQTA